MRIGIVTDAHYDTINFPGRLAVAQGVADIFKKEAVGLIIGLGDMYDNFDTIAEVEDTVPLYEAIWIDTGIETKFLTGNHDKQNIGLAAYQAISKLAPSENFTIDIGAYRFICYYNAHVEPGTYFSSPVETLTWLSTELAKCQTGGIDSGKKVIICTHCYIYQDYPGDPAWWTVEPYSVFSFNANEQRSIIEAAKAAGADIKAVFMGHAHSSRKVTVNTIDYYGFAWVGDNYGFAIVDIDQQDNIRIIGNGNQENINNLPNYYIAIDGHDNNSGLLRSLPYATLAKFSLNPVADKTANIMSGLWRTEKTIIVEGVSGFPIVYNFENGAIWSGCNVITGFTLINTEYQVALTTECKVVIKDGVMLTEGTAGSLATGQWDWVSGVLYLKDDPTGLVIEAGQRVNGLGITAATKNVIINNPNLYGYNEGAIGISSTPTTVVINNPVVERSRYGLADSSTSVVGQVTINNPKLSNNKQHGALITNGNTRYRNIHALNNKSSGVTISGLAAPKITGGLVTGNPTGVALATTGGAGVIIANIITKGNTTRGINSTGVGTTEIKNSCINEATNTWGTTTQTNNITTDPKVMSDGRLQKDSPCINTGAWVSGVGGNMSGELDFFGKQVYRLPNMGIDQGVDAPKHKQRKMEITMSNTMSANSTSKTVAVTNPASSFVLPGSGNTIYLCNIGYYPCYVVIGNSNDVATVSTSTSSSTSALVPSGTDRYLTIPKDATHISVVCASGETTNLYIQVGDVS